MAAAVIGVAGFLAARWKRARNQRAARRHVMDCEPEKSPIFRVKRHHPQNPNLIAVDDNFELRIDTKQHEEGVNIAPTTRSEKPLDNISYDNPMRQSAKLPHTYPMKKVPLSKPAIFASVASDEDDIYEKRDLKKLHSFKTANSAPAKKTVTLLPIVLQKMLERDDGVVASEIFSSTVGGNLKVMTDKKLPLYKDEVSDDEISSDEESRLKRGDDWRAAAENQSQKAAANSVEVLVDNDDESSRPQRKWVSSSIGFLGKVNPRRVEVGEYRGESDDDSVVKRRIRMNSIGVFRQRLRMNLINFLFNAINFETM